MGAVNGVFSGLSGLIGRPVSPQEATELKGQFEAMSSEPNDGVPSSEDRFTAVVNDFSMRLVELPPSVRSFRLTGTCRQMFEERHALAKADAVKSSLERRYADGFAADIDELFATSLLEQVFAEHHALHAKRVMEAIRGGLLGAGELLLLRDLVSTFDTQRSAALKNSLLALIAWNAAGVPQFPPHYHSLVKRATILTDPAAWEMWLQGKSAFDGMPSDIVTRAEAERGSGAALDSVLVLLHHGERELGRRALSLLAGLSRDEIFKAWVHLVAQSVVVGELVGVRRQLAEEALAEFEKMPEASAFEVEDAAWLTAALASASERAELADAETLADYLDGYAKRTTPEVESSGVGGADFQVVDSGEERTVHAVSGPFSLASGPVLQADATRQSGKAEVIGGVVPAQPDDGGVVRQVINDYEEGEVETPAPPVRAAQRSASAGERRSVPAAVRGVNPSTHPTNAPEAPPSITGHEETRPAPMPAPVTGSAPTVRADMPPGLPSISVSLFPRSGSGGNPTSGNHRP